MTDKCNYKSPTETTITAAYILSTK